MIPLLRPQVHQDNNSIENDPRADSLSISEDYSRSRHSSIEGPYYHGESTLSPSFPVYQPIIKYSDKDVYSRSLLGTGLGFAIRGVKGNTSRPAAHKRCGTIIGDVLYMDHSGGTFISCFNVFASPGNTRQQKRVPDNFAMFKPTPSEKDVATTISFPAGSIITSRGIGASRTSESPLKVEFSVDTPEGAVLILPTGAVREEIVDPSSLHSYIGEHARGWYQSFNGNSNNSRPGPYPIPNGTLWVVTAVDTASAWAMASIASPTNNRANATGKLIYDETNDIPFKTTQMNCQPQFEYGQTSNDDRVPVFLRVMAVALTPTEWNKHISPTSPKNYAVYGPLSLPSTGLRARVERFLQHMKILSDVVPKSPPMQCYMHPATVLLHILLFDNPTTSVGIVGDDVWVPHIQQRPLSQNELVKLMRRVVENSEIIDSNGVIKFVPLPKAAPKNKATKLISYLTRILPWSTKPLTKSQVQALSNIHRVISHGPPRQIYESEDDVSV